MAKLRRSNPSLAFVLAVATAAFTVSSAVEYRIINNAAGTRFDYDIGADFTKQTLDEASSFIWAIFGQPEDDDRQNVQIITCIIDNLTDTNTYPAYTVGSEIHLNPKYIARFPGDVKAEITGVLYHEAAHVWQWDGIGEAPSELIEGVADYVRLKAGFEPLDGHWVEPGQGGRWDQGYDVTAKFLDYCDGLIAGFVAKLNAKLKDGYSDDFFVELLGKTPTELFTDYKAAYA